MLRVRRTSLRRPVLASAALLLGCGDAPTAGAGGRVRERGLVAVGDPFEAAVRLIAVLKEYFLWPRLLGRSVRPDRAEVRHLVEELVDEFLRAHRPGNAGRVRTDPAPPARAAAAGERGTAGRE